MAPNPIIFFIIFFATFFIGSYFLIRNWKLAKTAQPWKTGASLTNRIKAVLLNVVFQKKLMKRPLRGLSHIFIFAGFFIYMVHTFSQIIGGFMGDYFFYIPILLGDGFLAFYDNLLDVFTLLVIFGCLYFWIRRYLLKAPELDRPSFQSVIVIGMILLLMVFTVLETPARGILTSETSDSLIRPLFASIGGALSSDPSVLFLIGWWGHILTIFAFLLVVPKSKHAHLFWAPLNYWFSTNEPAGHMSYMDVENASYWGAANVHEFTWKNYLDSLSCIECGRCQLQCPASRTGKLLSPKKIMTDLKHALVEKMPQVQARLHKGEEGTALSESGEYKVIDQYISRDEIWACTSCFACAEACPVGNNQLAPILDMRRSLVLNEGSMPSQLQGALQNIENQSNPWGISAEQREEWAKDLDVKTMAQWATEGKSPEILYWVGCAGAFDDRNKKVARSMVNLLNRAGISFGILGKEENCTGDSARRAGNEYLFQTLAQTNVEIMNNYEVKKIVTACPHCFNTLKNEYPDFNGNYEVIHHSEFLLSLVKEGKLPVSAGLGEMTYHDSCYLGRHNGVYEAPREIIKASGSLREPAEKREKSTCCGAGGAQMWMEETGERVNILRTGELLKTGAKTVATACPFCMTMIQDGVKSASEEAEVLDLAEIIEKGFVN